MRTWSWFAAIVLIVGCKGNPARDCAPYEYDPVLGVCTCPAGTRQGDGGGCFEYDGGTPPLDCPGGAAPIAVYADVDGDGHGNPGTERMGCPGEPSTAPIGDDCDDACATCRPGGTEVCDGADNDCAAGPDDTFACVQGTTTACTTTCGTSGTGACTSECAAPATCTPPSETCNEVDDDCDRLVDEDAVGVGEAVDPVPTLQGLPFVLPTTTGFLVLDAPTSAPFGLFAQHLDADARPLDDRQMIDASNITAFDADLDGSQVVIAFRTGTDLRALVMDETTLSVTSGPSLVATTSDAVIRVRDLGVSYLFITANDSTITTRQAVALGGSPPTPRTVATGRVARATSIDVLSPPDIPGRAYLAYAAVPTPSAGDSTTDTEIFVLALDGDTPLGAAHRTTDDALEDSQPSLAWASGDLAIAWIFNGDVAAFNGLVAAEIVRPVIPATWEEIVPQQAIEAVAASLATGRQVRLAARGDAWIVAAGQSSMWTRHSVALVARDLSSSRALPVPPVYADENDIIADFVTRGDRAFLTSLALSPSLDTGRVVTHPIGCP